jgi:hypothetical protein
MEPPRRPDVTSASYFDVVKACRHLLPFTNEEMDLLHFHRQQRNAITHYGRIVTEDAILDFLAFVGGRIGKLGVAIPTRLQNRISGVRVGRLLPTTRSKLAFVTMLKVGENVGIPVSDRDIVLGAAQALISALLETDRAEAESVARSVRLQLGARSAAVGIALQTFNNALMILGPDDDDRELARAIRELIGSSE